MRVGYFTQDLVVDRLERYGRFRRERVSSFQTSSQGVWLCHDIGVELRIEFDFQRRTWRSRRYRDFFLLFVRRFHEHVHGSLVHFFLDVVLSEVVTVQRKNGDIFFLDLFRVSLFF